MSCREGALTLDTDKGEVLLSSDAPRGFKWIIGGHQVGARWQEKEKGAFHHLGGPSPVHATDSTLRLWFAVDKEKNELVVILTMSIKSRSRSKARPRHLFMLVPAESLRLSSAMDDFDPVPVDAVPEALFERPIDVASAKTSRLLQVSFDLGHDTSRVIMNTRPYDGQLRGTPLALLDGLKSLSEAHQFELYFMFSSYAKVALKHIYTQMVHQPFITPSIDLVAMYRGAWDGGFDLWEIQGWRPRHPSLKRKASCLLEETQAPPAYVAGPVIPAPACAVSTIREAEPEEAIPPPGPPSDSQQDERQAISPSASPHVPVATERNSPQAEHQVTQPLHLQEPAPRYSPAVSPLVPEAVTRSNPQAEHHAASPIQTIEPTSPRPLPNSQSCIPETPHASFQRLFSTPSDRPSAPSVPLRLPTLFPPIDPSSLPRLYDHEMGVWLLTAWASIPNVHFTLLQPLLTIGAAVARQDICAYRDARMKCAKQFIMHLADQEAGTRVKKPGINVLSSEPDSLLQWLFMLRPCGDIGVTNLLAKLECKRRDVLRAASHGHGDEFESFMVVRAAIVLQVLVAEGPLFRERLKGKGGEFVKGGLDRLVEMGERGLWVGM